MPYWWWILPALAGLAALGLLVAAVRKRPKPFLALLGAESAFINALMELSLDRTAAGVHSFSKVANHSLRKVYGMDLRPLGVRAMELATTVLSSVGRVSDLPSSCSLPRPLLVPPTRPSISLPAPTPPPAASPAISTWPAGLYNPGRRPRREVSISSRPRKNRTPCSVSFGPAPPAACTEKPSPSTCMASAARRSISSIQPAASPIIFFETPSST